MVCLLRFLGCGGLAGLDAEVVDSGFQDVTAVGEAVKESSGLRLKRAVEVNLEIVRNCWNRFGPTFAAENLGIRVDWLGAA